MLPGHTQSQSTKTYLHTAAMEIVSKTSKNGIHHGAGMGGPYLKIHSQGLRACRASGTIDVVDSMVSRHGDEGRKCF